MEFKNVDCEKKIAVLTGGTGYIGRNLNLHLLANGWDTVLLVRPGKKTTYQENSVQGNSQLIEYDGTQESLDVIELPLNANIVFFHLATYSGVNGTATDLDHLIDTNILFGIHLLNFMLKNGYCNLIVAESYWQFDSNGFLSGNTLYATTKSAFSLFAEYFSKNLSIISLVIYDVYGPFDDRGKLVNLLINSALTQTPVNMTYGEQLLDYIYIDDVVRAFMVGGRLLLSTSSKNRGCFHRYTVRTMEVHNLRKYVELLGMAVGQNPRVKWGARPYPSHQIMKPWFPSAAIQLPSWQPSFTFYSGVKKVLEDE